LHAVEDDPPDDELPTEGVGPLAVGPVSGVTAPPQATKKSKRGTETAASLIDRDDKHRPCRPLGAEFLEVLGGGGVPRGTTPRLSGQTA